MSEQTLPAARLAALASAIRYWLYTAPRARRKGEAAGVQVAPALERLEDRVLLSGEAAQVVLDQPLLATQVAFASPGVIVAEVSPDSTTPPSNALTPSQIRHAYGIDQVMFGSILGKGQGQTIAIIDAYDYPTALADLQAFDFEFGLPDPPSFQRVAQDGSTNYPITDPAGAGNSSGTWEMEEALDIQWAHAIAPLANILLVEATDNSDANLIQHAVNWARSQPGVVAISMSFSGTEFSTEASFYDTYFTTPASHGGVTFLAATGDAGRPSGYPAYSPNVVAVGGTTLNLSGLNYVSETGWSGSGGGISSYENQPAYQQGVVTQSTTKRTNPDVAMDADPNTGVAVYDSYDYPTSPWMRIGGTSLATPMWAGLMAIVDQGRSLASLGSLDGRTETLPTLYTLPPGDFHDITSGNNGYAAAAGYDLVTGLGTPVANKLIYDLGGISAIGSIAGTVFEDANNNHVFDAGDMPLQGVEVYLDANGNGVFDPATVVTASSGTINKAIPDNRSSGVTTTLAFSGIAPLIADVTVTLNITHTRDSDLTAYLIGPDGTQVTLFSNIISSGTNKNFTNTTLSDAGATSITAGTAPFTGTFKPSPGPMSSFDGKTANGTWTLKVVDSRRNNTGTIVSWSLAVTTASEVSVTTGADGRYLFSSVAFGTYYVRQIVPLDEVQTAPDPAGPSGGARIVVVAGNVTGQDFADFNTLLSVTAVSLNDSKSRSVSAIDPGGAGVRTIQVTFSQAAVFTSASVVLQEVTFPGGAELLGALLTPLSVTGSGTNTMIITLAGESAIDTWVKVTLKAATTTTLLSNPLDGEAPLTGSGRGYIAEAAVDLPSGDGVPGGNAVFYVGSLRGDFTGDGAIAADDKAAFLAAWRAGSLDADFRGVGFGVRPPDGRITLADLDGFTSVYLAAVAAGRRLDPLPLTLGGQIAGPSGATMASTAQAVETAPAEMPAAPSAPSPAVDLLAEAAGQLLAASQATVAAAAQQTSPFTQGDETPADEWSARRRRPAMTADAPFRLILRI